MSTSPNRSTVAMTIAVALWSPHTLSDTAVWQYPGNQHFYKQYDTNLTTQNAYRFCARHHGYAVSIGDAKENKFVSGMLQTTGVRSAMIGLAISKKVITKQYTTPIAYELQGRWADGSRFQFHYADNTPTPPPDNSFEGFVTLPYGVQAYMNARGVWSDGSGGSVLSRSAREVNRPFTIETYTVQHAVSSIICEWDAAPDTR